MAQKAPGETETKVVVGPFKVTTARVYLDGI